MKYLSLFSGIGGFELGIKKAHERLRIKNKKKRIQGIGNPKGQSRKRTDIRADGFTCVGYSEIDKYATQIYQSHFPDHKNYGDIKNINAKELPDFDLLVGGFPCQSFSIAGKRGGFDDTRGTLFFDIARIIKEKKPRLLLLENVKGLLSHDDRQTFKLIIATLNALGYDVQWQVLNSKNFGVPQNRERVFIIGHLGGTPRPEVFPFTEKSNPHSTQSKSTETAVARTLTAGGHSGGNHSGMTIIAKTIRSGGRSSPHGSKQNWDSYEVKGKIRRLTPTECERLQGFPDGWTEGVSDSQRYKCLGNAVTVNVIESIIGKLINHNHK